MSKIPAPSDPQRQANKFEQNLEALIFASRLVGVSGSIMLAYTEKILHSKTL